MQRKQKLTPNESRILANYSSKYSPAELAEKAFTSIQAVYRAVRKFNLELRQMVEPLTEEQKEIIRDMARPNVGIKAIQELVPVPRRRIYDFLVLENLPFRQVNNTIKLVPDESKVLFDWNDFGNTVY